MFRVGDEVEKFQHFGHNPKSTLLAPPIGHRGTITAVGLGWIEIDTWPSDPMWGLQAEEYRKIQRRDIEAWLETATDFEEPKRVPAGEDA